MSIITEREPLPRTEQSPDRDAVGDSAQASAKLYRTVWRWHFFAGMIVGPVLIVAATTGGLYIFKAEIESVVYRDLLYVAPGGERVPCEQLLATLIGGAPEGFQVHQFIVPHDSTEAVLVYGSVEGSYRRLYVDPYRGDLLGSLGPNDFFRVVLDIHRTLFAGTLGRVVVELTTCWTIVLLISGLYLWWPRKGRRSRGTWLPRLRGLSYATFRDLHAISGAYVAVVAMVIAVTGLVYSYVWGQGFQYVALETGAYDLYVNPPQASEPEHGRVRNLDEIVATAAAAMPEMTLTVRMPADPSLAYVVFGSIPGGPSTDALVVIDQGTGKVLQQRTVGEFPAMAQWATWNYPLHVGSVLGLWTQVPWLVACLLLTLLPVSGAWMWWARRPQGTAGLPRRYHDVAIPRWMVVLIVILAVVLPVVGISLAIVISADWFWNRIRVRRTVTAA